MMDNRLRVIKRILSKYRACAIKVAKLEEQIAEIDARAYGMKTAQLDAMPSGGKPKTTFDMIDRKADIQRKLERMRMVSGQKREIVEAYINTVRWKRGREYLTEYYLNIRTLDDIANINGVSVPYVSKVKSKAERKIDLSIDLE